MVPPVGLPVAPRVRVSAPDVKLGHPTSGWEERVRSRAPSAAYQLEVHWYNQVATMNPASPQPVLRPCCTSVVSRQLASAAAVSARPLGLAQARPAEVAMRPGDDDVEQ